MVRSFPGMAQFLAETGSVYLADTGMLYLTVHNVTVKSIE